MNKVILMGRLTKDPDVKYTQTGKVVTQFTLAVDRPFKDANGNKETDFIPVVVWGKAAELVEFVERKSDKGGTSGDKSEFEQFGHAVPFDEDIPF